MFKKNDNALLISRGFLKVCYIILAVVLGIVGLVFASEEPLMIVFSLFSIFFCWIGWIFSNLLFSLLLDIKLIRNKLYNLENGNIQHLVQEETIDNKESPLEGKLKELNKLLEDNVISEEEYTQKRKEILSWYK